MCHKWGSLLYYICQENSAMDFCECTEIKIINGHYLKIDNFKKDKLSKPCPKFQGFFEWFKDVALNYFIGLYCPESSDEVYICNSSVIVVINCM